MCFYKIGLKLLPSLDQTGEMMSATTLIHNSVLGKVDLFTAAMLMWPPSTQGIGRRPRCAMMVYSDNGVTGNYFSKGESQGGDQGEEGSTNKSGWAAVLSLIPESHFTHVLIFLFLILFFFISFNRWKKEG